MLKVIVPILILVLFSSCEHASAPQINYCKMITQDQSFVNNDRSDITKYKADKKTRHLIFEQNFDQLMKLTEQAGFPLVTIKDLPKDSCKYYAITMTMIHTAQSKPKLFFSKKMATLFKTEMDKGNIQRSLLEQASKITAMTISLCADQRVDISYALELWGLDAALFKDAQFIKCM